MTKNANDILRGEYGAKIKEFLEAQGEEVLITGSNEIAFPVVDCDGTEKFLVLKLQVPKGSRDGELYDGYAMAEEYKLKMAEKAEKAEKAAAAKAKKIERDKAFRAKQAELKAQRENGAH